MAKIIVEKATVQRVFQTRNGWGVSVFETFQRRDNGGEGKNWFTLWLKEQPNVVEGSVVSASGFHGVRVREYEGNDGETRHSADVSVNGARLLSVEGPVPAAADEPWGASGQTPAWNVPPSADEPF